MEFAAFCYKSDSKCKINADSDLYFFWLGEKQIDTVFVLVSCSIAPAMKFAHVFARLKEPQQVSCHREYMKTIILCTYMCNFFFFTL